MTADLGGLCHRSSLATRSPNATRSLTKRVPCPRSGGRSGGWQDRPPGGTPATASQRRARAPASVTRATGTRCGSRRGTGRGAHRTAGATGATTGRLGRPGRPGRPEGTGGPRRTGTDPRGRPGGLRGPLRPVRQDRLPAHAAASPATSRPPRTSCRRPSSSPGAPASRSIRRAVRWAPGSSVSPPTGRATTGAGSAAASRSWPGSRSRRRPRTSPRPPPNVWTTSASWRPYARCSTGSGSPSARCSRSACGPGWTTPRRRPRWTSRSAPYAPGSPGPGPGCARWQANGSRRIGFRRGGGKPGGNPARVAER